MNAVFCLLIFWNLMTLFLMGFDKRRAQRGGRRVRERTLLLCAACFGAFGALAGMFLFRHKTRHMCFRVLLPLFCALQAAALLFLQFYIR